MAIILTFTRLRGHEAHLPDRQDLHRQVRSYRTEFFQAITVEGHLQQSEADKKSSENQYEKDEVMTSNFHSTILL